MGLPALSYAPGIEEAKEVEEKKTAEGGRFGGQGSKSIQRATQGKDSLGSPELARDPLLQLCSTEPEEKTLGKNCCLFLFGNVKSKERSRP